VHLMSTKSNAFPLLQSFITLIETQFGASVKCVRSDNGMEFQDTTAFHFYTNKGIIHQKSCVDTPQQNGVVERKHKHLLEVARALLIQANLPQHFWGDSVLTAAYLINRFPTPLLENRTPFELLYKERPSYAHLRVFGCLCYASKLKKGRSKLQSRASTCIFLGYLYAQKAYKVFDLQSKKVIISRDVVFFENCFLSYSRMLIVILLFHFLFMIMVKLMLLLWCSLLNKQSHVQNQQKTISILVLLL